MVGLGSAAKIYPVVLLPVLVIVVSVSAASGRRFCRRHRGRSGGGRFVPFSVASFSGTWGRCASSSREVCRSRASRVPWSFGRHAAEKLTAPGFPSPSDFRPRARETD